MFKLINNSVCDRGRSSCRADGEEETNRDAERTRSDAYGHGNP